MEKKTALIGQYKLLDGWHTRRVFDNAKEAASWRNAVDQAGGHEHARRTVRVKKTSETYLHALEVEWAERTIADEGRGK